VRSLLWELPRTRFDAAFDQRGADGGSDPAAARIENSK